MIKSVREDIHSYKKTSPEAFLLSERERIDRTQSTTEHVISIAYAAQEGISQQRGLLNKSKIKIEAMVDRFPLIGHVLGKIRWRRNCDIIIIALFISFTNVMALELSRLGSRRIDNGDKIRLDLLWLCLDGSLIVYDIKIKLILV